MSERVTGYQQDGMVVNDFVVRGCLYEWPPQCDDARLIGKRVRHPLVDNRWLVTD